MAFLVALDTKLWLVLVRQTGRRHTSVRISRRTGEVTWTVWDARA